MLLMSPKESGVVETCSYEEQEGGRIMNPQSSRSAKNAVGEAYELRTTGSQDGLLSLRRRRRKHLSAWSR